MATGGVNLSNEFFELLKAIGESKSKQEEDRIIAKEVQRLKQKLEAPAGGSHGNTLFSSKKRAREFLVRLLYVEMLGHDGSFGYIKAVELAASASLYHKRTGYLVCGACLPPDHEFRFMLVNQMQRDLQSANVLECSGGLLACSSIITADMVPAVAGEVTKLLTHESATIRKKSVITLHKFHQLAPEVVSAEELGGHVRKSICDKDPSVMGSSLNVIYALCLDNSQPFKDLVPSLVSILKQIADHRLPSEYDYHRVPAPWMQLKLVRILGILGQADAAASSGMYEIIADTMKKADTGINAGYAIVYECVKTIVSIYPNTNLLNAAADAIARFIDSRSHNLKYLGVTGLAMIVESQPQYAAQHQLAVMDCLEDPDETLQRKTLDLLYRMTNPVNVEFISEKLVDFLSGTTDLFLKKQLTTRVCSISERYAPNNAWYIRTITKLFEVSGDMVSQEVAQNLMSLIAEGTGESEEADMLLRQNAVEIYVVLLRDKPLGSLPRILLETMAWCLGEYGYLSAASTLDQVLQMLCDLARVHKAKLAPTTRRFLISAIMKLVAQAGTCPPAAAAVIDDYTKSQDVDLQQRCLEFQAILTACPNLLPEILPVDASAEDVDVDQNLSFLDGYVSNALHNGARPYEKPEDDDDEDDDNYGASNGATGSGFNLTPYAKPQTPSTMLHLSSGMGSGQQRVANPSGVSLPPGAHNTGGGGGGSVASQQHQPPSDNIGLNVKNVANVWGRQSSPQHQAAAPAPAAPAPASPASNAWGSSSVGGGGMSGGSNAYGGSSSVASAPAPAPVKTAAQLERERQAAALFGGIVPGAPPPPPSQTSAPTSAPPPPAAVTAPPVSAPAPPPAPAAPEIDLLDLGGWGDDSPAPAVEAPVAATTNFEDKFAPAPETTHAAPVVETVSDDDDDGGGGGLLGNGGSGAASSVTAPSAAVPPAPAMVDDDPFASAGLLSDVDAKPLPSLQRSAKFEYGSTPMAPMPINTAQFGQQWGSCKATFPTSVQSSKISSLEQFMTLCADIGAHKIEAITATNEGICAGMIGAQVIALIHGKVTPLGAGSAKLDVTVKSTDQQMGSALAMYIQTMLR